MKKQLVVALLSMTMSASLLFPAAVQAAEEPLNNQDNQTVEALEELVNIDAVDKPELELIDEEPEMPADARTTDTVEKRKRILLSKSQLTSQGICRIAKQKLRLLRRRRM